MKSKLIITNVDCIYEHASDFPRTFFIELTPDIQRRIKQLSMLVKLSEVYNIEEFHSCGFWSNSESDMLRSKQASTNDIRSTLAQHQTNVECPLLSVQRDTFGWTRSPKHCGDHMLLMTPRIPIDFLDKNDSLFTNF